MNTDPTKLSTAKFKVESTDPHAPDDRADERFGDLSISDAAGRVEDLSGIRASEVFTDLALTDHFEWECPETGRTVTADGLGAEPVAVGGRP